MNQGVKTSIAEQIQHLQTAYLNQVQLGENQKDVTDAFLNFVLERERLRHSVIAGTKKAEAVDKQTLDKMKNWDSNDPAMSTVEKSLRRIATGRGAEAATLIEKSIHDRQALFRKQQREKAKRPRPRAKSPLAVLVEGIVNHDRKITAQQLFMKLIEKLRSMDCPPYIASRGAFESQNVRYPDVKRDTLRQYLQRAKAKSSR